MSIHNDISLASTLFPSAAKDKERPMLVIARLINKVIELATANLINKDLRRFDANPGDAACQLQALKLHQLVRSSALLKEAQMLQDQSKKLKAVIDARARNQKAKSLPESFFKEHIESIHVSRDMLYLIRTTLLTITKVVKQIEPNGIVVTKTNPEALNRYVRKISHTLGDSPLNHLVADVAAQLSRHSIELIQQVAKEPLTREMLSEKHIKKPESNGYAKKSFACQTFQIMALLNHIKEQETVLALKSVVTEGEPVLILMKASKEGIRFLTEKERMTLDKEVPLIVFEGVVRDEKAIKEQIEKIGFEHVVLVQAAQAPQIGPTSTLDDIENREAREVIANLRKSAKELDLDNALEPFLLLDHVYCATLDKEKGRQL